MTLLQLTLKNLSRRRVRTALTIMGIGLGIGAVVALLGLAWGLEASWTDAYKVRKTDLVVRRSGGGLIAQPFPDSASEQVAQIPGVSHVASLLTEVLSIESVPMMVVSGRQWQSFLWENLKIVSGRLPTSADEKVVVLGTLAAEMLEKKPGDKITIEIDEFEVVGIADGGAVVENGAIMISLPLLQGIMQKDKMVNFINVRLDPKSRDPHTVSQVIQQHIPGCRVDIAEEVLSQSDGVKTFKAMNWGTSIIALLVGIIAGIALLKILTLMPWMQGRIEPQITIELLSLALGLAIAVGVASGLYPALHCTRINPSLAIRQV